LGLVKKVRLTVKLVLSDNFKKIIESEERGPLTRVISTPTVMTHASTAFTSKATISDPEESKFDKEDLELKNSADAKDHLIHYLSKDELALEYESASHQNMIEEDPNFQISHLIPDDEEVDEDEEGLEEP
jgi:hypothetical protein